MSETNKTPNPNKEKNKMTNVDELLDVIRSKQWKKVQQTFMQVHPERLYDVRTSNNATVLHVACLHRPPTDVIRALFTASQADNSALNATATNTEGRWWWIHKLMKVQDDQGWTCLHVAFLYGNSDDVLLLLIRFSVVCCGQQRQQQQPQQQIQHDLQQTTNTDSKVHKLKKGHNASPNHQQKQSHDDKKHSRFSYTPHLLSIVNHHGWSPLHLACRHGTSLRVLTSLLNAHPPSALLPTASGVNPMHLLWAMCMKDDTLRQQVYNANSAHEMQQVVQSDPRMEVLWQGMSLLALAGYRQQRLQNQQPQHVSSTPSPTTNQNQNQSWNILHATTMLAAQGLTPPGFLTMAVKMCPDQLSRANEWGQLPLHVAASTQSMMHNMQHRTPIMPYMRRYPRIPPSNHNHTQNPNENENENPLLSLLQAHPPAAKVHDANGRLPLSLAIETKHLEWTQGMEQVMCAAPQALVTRDCVTRLNPFLLACVEGSKVSLDVSFELLRSCPCQVMGGVPL